MPGLVHAVTTRRGGVSAPPFDTLNLGLGTDDATSAARENRRRVAARLGFERLVTPYQIHGDVVREADQDTDRPRCDGLVVERSGVLVGVLGADCPGVLLVDADAHRLAVVHAGWRGVAGGVVGSAIAALGSRPEALLAWIGPGIGVDRYQVDDPVLSAVAATVPHLDPMTCGIARPDGPGHARVSLRHAIEEQLVASGLLRGNVFALDACTFDDAERFYSHRRDGPRSGRHALVAGWS